jgi:16S rRNA (uracil1498-N3)-methyltransferase
MDQTKLYNTPRLFISGASFAQGEILCLDEDKAHYLRSVLRKIAGDSLRVFNGRDGEWRATMIAMNKKSVDIQLEERLRAQSVPGPLSLIVSPIKKERLEWLVEKCSEIGVESIFLVNMQHTARPHTNLDRLNLIAIEAAEQCERLDITRIYECDSLENCFNALEKKTQIVACVERQGAQPLDRAALTGKKLAVLVGPEGGFSAEEKAFLLQAPRVTPVTLGDNILRSETAALVALAQAGLYI